MLKSVATNKILFYLSARIYRAFLHLPIVIQRKPVFHFLIHPIEYTEKKLNHNIFLL